MSAALTVTPMTESESISTWSVPSPYVAVDMIVSCIISSVSINHESSNLIDSEAVFYVNQKKEIKKMAVGII